jgi:hypothetical protein
VSFFANIFKKKIYKCTNCNALITKITYDDHNGMCGLCASNVEIAAKRKKILEAQLTKGVLYPTCAKCGVYERQRLVHLMRAEKLGAFWYMKDWPVFLYCDKCDKYFCGACQLDLGMDSGCPICSHNLEK